MKELKFRAWDDIQKKMWYDGIHISMGGSIVATFGIYTPSHRLTIEQYTGLKDTDGAEIYEGDIVEYDDVYGVVKFGRIALPVNGGEYIIEVQGFYTEVVYDLDTERVNNAFVGGYVIRVGNIHENPELVGQK